MNHTTADLIRTLVERGATDEAQTLADGALRAATGVDRAELLLAQSAVHSHRGSHVPALSAAVEAGEIFREAGLPDRLCDALTATAGTLRAAGDYETSLATLEHAETLARQGGDELRRARALRSIGIVSSVLRRHQHALSCLEEAGQLFAARGSTGEQLHVRLSQLNGYGRWLDDQAPGSVTPAVIETHLQDWLKLADALHAAGQTRTALMAWGNHAIGLQRAGRSGEAADALQALLPRYREAGMRPNEGLALAELARCHDTLGDRSRARERYREARALLRERGTQDDLMQALEGLASTEEQLGDLAAALAALKELRALEKQRTDEAAGRALLQRELRVELARLTNQWARQAAQDPLTGLGNRRALDRWIAEHWPQVERGHPLTVVLIDLDYFKRINDTLGHDTGDRVLEAMGGVLKAQCRGSDLAVRYGGEEFVLAMAGTVLESAGPLAERLREAVAAHDWSRIRPDLAVTASLGVADATEVLDPAGLLTLADRRLYAAKLSGRNRVVAWG